MLQTHGTQEYQLPWPPGLGDQGAPCVPCASLLALVRQLESVGGRVCLQASESLQENVLTVHACRLQEFSGGVPALGWEWGNHNHLGLPSPAKEWKVL